MVLLRFVLVPTSFCNMVSYRFLTFAVSKI